MLLHSRYHIPTQPAPPPPGGYPAQFHLDDGSAYVKYGHQVFAGSAQRGDPYWTAEIVTQTWYMAETGRIPISGAGYGGKFAGEGFEGIWLDMSEIVRPTRDGIHGREYISTQVELGGGITALEFDPGKALLTTLPPAISLPIPVIFDPLPAPLPGRSALRSLAQAAARLQTLALIAPQDYDEDLAEWADWLAPRLEGDALEAVSPSWSPRYVEIEDLTGLKDPSGLIERITSRWPAAVIAVRMPLSSDAAEMAVECARAGVAVLHVYADEVGLDLEGRTLPEALRGVHTRLVEAALRDRVCIVASGGIAAAEHVAKAIACGADLVAIDFALQVAWGCSLWADKGKCPAESGAFESDWGAQRVVNLMNAWRDQFLEALGAMGMREVRRLRGEVGRTIWQEQEEISFRKMLGGSAPMSRYPRLPQPAGGEGDFR